MIFADTFVKTRIRCMRWIQLDVVNSLRLRVHEGEKQKKREQKTMLWRPYVCT